jgi:subfamily B ATP-binding cassette protein MsbA
MPLAVQAPERSGASVRREFGRILALSRGQSLRLSVALVLAVANTLVVLSIPWGLRELVDTAFASRSPELLRNVSLALFAIFCLHGLMSFGTRYLLSWAGERIVADFRTRIYQHLHTLSPRFFDNVKVGQLSARLINDVETVRTAATGALAELFTSAIGLAGAGVLMFVINWRLALIVVAVVPLVTVATMRFGTATRDLSRGVQDRLAELSAIAQETLAAIRVVAAFARGGHEVRRFREGTERLFEVSRRRAMLAAAFSALVSFLFFSAVGALFWFGGMEVLAGRLSTGDLIASVVYALSIATGTRNVAGLYTIANGAVGSSQRLYELLDEAPDVADAPGAEPLPPVRGHIALRDVTFGYDPTHPVLQSVSIEVEPGATVALVGPSGSGKTTILHLVSRFYDVAGGSVSVDGRDVRSVTMESLRRQIALVPQDVHLFHDTVEANIRYGKLDASHHEVVEAARAANAHSFITALPGGYGTVVGERGLKLSGGQRQRIAIARAMLSDAPIILLDEATSALDSEAEALVREALERLRAGRTILVVAHRLATVRSADRIYVVEGGRVVEQGTHAELIAGGGAYSRTAAVQFLKPAEPEHGDDPRGLPELSSRTAFLPVASAITH